MENLPIRVQHARLQPLLDEPQERAIFNAFF
jgi:hypothetical protein